jgi:hypothetical protein
MSTKLSAEQVKTANELLGRLDKIAAAIQANHESWGMPMAAAKPLVNDIDKVADELEKLAFGTDSLGRRQVEVLKQAKVIQKDSDEKYMDTFNAPMAPHQTDADEPYMAAYKDDQSQAVQVGKSTTGRPLAP